MAERIMQGSEEIAADSVNVAAHNKERHEKQI